jgi:hypothetical protein
MAGWTFAKQKKSSYLNKKILSFAVVWSWIIRIKFLEHIFKKMGSTEIVMSSVRPSVRL